MALVTEYVGGLVFGVALFASGVYSPKVIMDQMSLSSFHMMKTMLAGSAMSALIIQGADHLDVHIKPRSSSNHGIFPYDGNIIGGMLIGLGMAVSGACPGTSLVQVAVGVNPGRLVVLGGILGSLVFPTIVHMLPGAEEHASCVPGQRPKQLSPSTTESLAHTLNLSPRKLLIAWELLCLSVLCITDTLESKGPRVRSSALVSPVTGGLLVGFAQAVSVGLNRHAVGVSRAYSDVSKFLMEKVNAKTGWTTSVATRVKFFTPATVFAIGIMSGSALLALVSPSTTTAANPQSDAYANIFAFLGGFVMVVGSHLAGGCTSGHGISGLATFSNASVLTVCSMMLCGIAIRVCMW